MNAVAKSLICAFLVCLGQFLCPIGLLAENPPCSTVDDYAWPVITLVWSVGVDNYYIAGCGQVEAYPQISCPSGCCWPVSFTDKKTLYDGSEWVEGQTWAEGFHTFQFSVKANNGSGDPNYYREETYSSSKVVFVDATPPSTTFTKPEDPIISTADVSVVYTMSDTASKLGAALVRLAVEDNTPCRFKKDLLGAPVDAAWIQAKYCSDEYYTDPNSQGCDVNMGMQPANFATNHDLRDYSDFSSGQDCKFQLDVGATDRVGNTNTQSLHFTVDQAPPAVAIADPVALSTGMSWTNPDEPVISGTAVDISEITRVWLTIKDESADRWWNGAEWRAGITTVSATEKTGTTNVAWKYEGLRREVMRSGIFTITAYARDKFGHVGHAMVSGKNKRKYALGKKDFTDFAMHMKEVINIGAARSDDNPYTFIATKDAYDEGIIRVTAEITPEKLSGILNNYVMWNVLGANAYSGKPNAPHGGNPSTFFVEIPPIPAIAAGRPGPMGYTVFPRVEYDFKDEHKTYEGADHGMINQDNLDTLRQEYIDLGTTYNLPRTRFDQDLPVFPGLLVSPGFETGKHQWHILKNLNAKAIALNNAYGGGLIPTSGYRCPIGNKNKDVKGVYNSNHMLGVALDYNQGNPQDNCDVWEAATTLSGVTENYLYVDDVIIYNPVCPPLKGVNYNHGHVAW